MKRATMRRGYLMLALSAVLLTGCATSGRLMSYGTELADAKFTSDGRGYSAWVHPKDPTILLERPMGVSVGKGFVSGLTVGLISGDAPYATWESAFKKFVEPTGCKVDRITALDPKMAWEGDYTCPPGVELRALVSAQREALRAGQPLHL